MYLNDWQNFSDDLGISYDLYAKLPIQVTINLSWMWNALYSGGWTKVSVKLINAFTYSSQKEVLILFCFYVTMSGTFLWIKQKNKKTK